MAWAHDGRTPTNPNAPEPIGYCDRCYRRRFLSDLLYQYDVRGNALVSLGIRVCSDTCYDEPADILRPIIIQGPEGFVDDPRPPNYAQNFAGGVPAPGAIGEFLFPNEIPDDIFLETDAGIPLDSDDGTPLIEP